MHSKEIIVTRILLLFFHSTFSPGTFYHHLASLIGIAELLLKLDATIRRSLALPLSIADYH